MPIYSYKCKDCGKIFDLLLGVTREKTELKCKKCGSKNIEKQFSTFGIDTAGSSGNASLPSYPTGSCPTGTCPLG